MFKNRVSNATSHLLVFPSLICRRRIYPTRYLCCPAMHRDTRIFPHYYARSSHSQGPVLYYGVNIICCTNTLIWRDGLLLRASWGCEESLDLGDEGCLVFFPGMDVKTTGIWKVGCRDLLVHQLGSSSLTAGIFKFVCRDLGVWPLGIFECACRDLRFRLTRSLGSIIRILEFNCQDLQVRLSGFLGSTTGIFGFDCRNLQICFRDLHAWLPGYPCSTAGIFVFDCRDVRVRRPGSSGSTADIFGLDCRNLRNIWLKWNSLFRFLGMMKSLAFGVVIS